MLDIPTEGRGFSNYSTTPYLGPPDLSKVIVAMHSGDNPITVRMKCY